MLWWGRLKPANPSKARTLSRPNPPRFTLRFPLCSLRKPFRTRWFSVIVSSPVFDSRARRAAGQRNLRCLRARFSVSFCLSASSSVSPRLRVKITPPVSQPIPPRVRPWHVLCLFFSSPPPPPPPPRPPRPPPQTPPPRFPPPPPPGPPVAFFFP